VVYANETNLADFTLIAEAAASEAAAPLFGGLGFTKATAQTYADQSASLASGTTGRFYSRTLTTFTIDPQVSGTVNIGGAGIAYEFISGLGTSFTGSYPNTTTNVQIEGVVAGVRRLCNGEIDIAVSFAPLTAEQTENCNANNITPTDIALGKEAAVLVSNAGSSYLFCLTTDQLATLWRAAANETVNTWLDVDPSFPEAMVTLLSPDHGNPYLDLLLLTVTNSPDPGRSDANLNADPLYRAAAVANVEGAITVMSWTEYQLVENANQSNIQLVSVDSGNGCVPPSESSIDDGSYAITRPVNLVVNFTSMAKPEVQAFLWHTLSDENYISFQTAGLIGLDFGDLPNLRANLQELFTAATVEAAAQAAAALSTAEATSEATVEVTSESTSEAGN
jgi:phosphate transport system substrate-binding protein